MSLGLITQYGSTDLQVCMELIFFLGGILNSIAVLMHISPTIQYNAGHSYKINTHSNTGADEFVAWDEFSPWEDFFILVQSQPTMYM